MNLSMGLPNVLQILLQTMVRSTESEAMNLQQ